MCHKKQSPFPKMAQNSRDRMAFLGCEGSGVCSKGAVGTSGGWMEGGWAELVKGYST